jgi:hypothetical protein
MLTAAKLKVSTVLKGEEFANMPVPNDARMILRVKVGERTLTADVATKSVRRAQATIRESSPHSIALVLQGVLVGEKIYEAGLMAQVKEQKKLVGAEARVLSDEEAARRLK